MNRLHPHKSKNYIKQKIVRGNREDHRRALKKAQYIILSKEGLVIDKLQLNKNVKKHIKQMLNKYKNVFKILIKEIKVDGE